MTTPTAAELRAKNPWSSQHRNLTWQGQCQRSYPDLATELRAEAERAEAARKAMMQDVAACWAGVLRAYPAHRAEIEALRRKLEK